MSKELTEVHFWYNKSDKCCDRALGFGFTTVSKFGNPKTWKKLQEIFEELQK